MTTLPMGSTMLHRRAPGLRATLLTAAITLVLVPAASAGTRNPTTPGCTFTVSTTAKAGQPFLVDVIIPEKKELFALSFFVLLKKQTLGSTRWAPRALSRATLQQGKSGWGMLEHSTAPVSQGLYRLIVYPYGAACLPNGGDAIDRFFHIR